MNAARSVQSKDELLRAGIALLRRNGYVATTVDEICAEAGVTKGAFFHHFSSKEALALACLNEWDCNGANMEVAAPFQALSDPVEKVLGCIDFYMSLMQDPKMIKSCLAGTIVQEVSQTHPELRDAACICFTNAETRFQAMLEEACRSRHIQADTASLASLWAATLQGSLILYKASGDMGVMQRNLEHLKSYLRLILTEKEKD